MYLSKVCLVLYCILGFLLVTKPVGGDVFTSTDRLKALIRVESTLLTAVADYIAKQAQAGKDLEEEWKEVYEKIKSQHEVDANKTNFIENPINSYHLLKRLTISWQPLLDYIICEQCEDWETVNAQAIKKIHMDQKQKMAWPSEADCKGAALSLSRLSVVYSLNMTELLEGRIYDDQTDPITDDDIFHIVQIVEEKQMIYQCLKWLNAGRRRALNGEDKKKSIRFYKYIASLYFGESMPWKSLEVVQTALEMFPDNKGLQRDRKYFSSRVENVTEKQRKRKIRRPTLTKLTKNYEALCSGRKGTPKNGTCRYKKTRIPIYVVKQEILSMDPRISMFYEVIYEPEIQHIKNRALEKLDRSVVVGDHLSDIRISQSAWLKDDDKIITRVSKRVELLTGMSLTIQSSSSHSEYLQVLNYGIGGMYEAHYDFFNCSCTKMDKETIELSNSGDRVATWLFYLNEVKAGGATVYPEINVRVPVTKGAAAYWFNLKRNSWGDDRTLHAGCPVLLGSKWVANKWIRLNGNIFNAKCGLTFHETYSW